MKLEITKDEQALLLAALEAAVKHSSNSLQSASVLLPLAVKVQECKDAEPGPEAT